MNILFQTIDVLMRHATYTRVDDRGEPQLGRRSLYRAISGHKDRATGQMSLHWILNLADGCHSLPDMAECIGLAFEQVTIAADAAVGADLIRQTPQGGAGEGASTVPKKS